MEPNLESMGRCDAVTYVGYVPCAAARWRELANHRFDALRCEDQIDPGRRQSDRDERTKSLGLKSKPRAAVATRSPASDAALPSIGGLFATSVSPKIVTS